jgi:hypothetical protein
MLYKFNRGFLGIILRNLTSVTEFNMLESWQNEAPNVIQVCVLKSQHHSSQFVNTVTKLKPRVNL